MKKILHYLSILLIFGLLGGAIHLTDDRSKSILPLNIKYGSSSSTTFNANQQQACHLEPTTSNSCNGDVPSGCSIFTVSKGDQVFFGGNDDYINPDNYYWVDPHGHGAIWIGTPDNVQQGVNSQGLAYDANGLPLTDVNPHLEREPVTGGYSSYPIQILRENATVEQVIKWVNSHQWHSYMLDQLHFADATGNAVVISAGADGEVAFTRKPPGDAFLVSTNFNLANPSNGDYPCWRYDTAQDLLGELLEQEGRLTAASVTNVLDAVHVEGTTGWTIGSILADLTNGTVYLYYFHQYDQPVVLNVAQEIANNREPGPLSGLFPEKVQQEATRRFETYQRGAESCRNLGMLWLLLVLSSLVVLFITSIKQRQGLIFWFPVVLILGPLGLLIWLLAKEKLKKQSGRAVMVEMAGDLTPVVIGIVVFLVVVLLVPSAQNSQSLQLLLIFVMPLAIALIAFHGPLLNKASGLGYMGVLWRRLPHAWVTTNLAMGGIFLFAFPLVTISLQSCSVISLIPWTLSAWWGLLVVGSLVAMALLLFYEAWAGRRNFQAWSVLASGEGEVRTASWKNLWWWILLSFVILLAGAAGGVMIVG